MAEPTRASLSERQAASPGADADEADADAAQASGRRPLTPVQQTTLERLGAKRSDRPTFPAGLADDLRALLDDELAGPTSALPVGVDLFVNKHALASVHGCEARWHADALDPGFTPSPPLVRGSVAHKAIELSLNRRRSAEPGDLVDRALDSLERSDRWMADWLQSCTEDERAEVRGGAVATVAAFSEIWPPLESRWRPVTEAAVRQDLAGGRITVSGRVDLSLGKAEGLTAGKVIVDFKTGGFALHHLDDLRFYALIETLRIGTPPRALATSYLESGQLHVEHVTEGLLEAAAARTVDGIDRMVGILHEGDEPFRRPSGACRWCRVRSGCGPGQEHLAAKAAADQDW